MTLLLAPAGRRPPLGLLDARRTPRRCRRLSRLARRRGHHDDPRPQRRRV